MRYPSRSTSTIHRSAPLSLQACQWRDRQPPDRVRQGDGSYFQKPEGLEGADPLPPLKCLRPPDRDEGAERFPYGRPARGGPEAEGSTSGGGGGRTRLPPPQRTRHGQVRRNQRRPLNLGYDFTEDILVKQARTRARSHSERSTLSLRHWNRGVHKEALTTLSPHGGGTS